MDSFHVLDQVIPRGEQLFADVTCKWFHPCVRHLVAGEGKLVEKFFAAYLAGKLFLPSVDSLVVLQVGTCVENFATYITKMDLFFFF